MAKAWFIVGPSGNVACLDARRTKREIEQNFDNLIKFHGYRAAQFALTEIQKPKRKARKKNG